MSVERAGTGRQASRRSRRSLRIRAGSLALPLLLGACGAKGPPKPPLSKAPEPVQDLFVRQSGPFIETRWSRPTRRTDGAPVDGPLLYEVLARAEDRSQSVLPSGPRPRSGLLAGSEDRSSGGRASEETLKGATVVARIAEPGARAKRNEEGIQPASAAGPFHGLLGPEVFPGARFTSVRLAITVVARDIHGRRSRPGAIVEIDPVPPLPPLESFTATGAREGAREGVRLTWRAPAGTTSAAVNVYRRLASSDPGKGFPSKPIAGSPFSDDHALDTSARLGESYVYEGRLVSTAPGKGLREGGPTTAFIDYVDRFPPGAPSLLTAEVVQTASAPPTIRLRWSSPIDPDVAGYRVYRADGEGPRVLRGQVSGGDTSWEDTQVVPGVRYHYTVTALDSGTPPNESEASEAVDVEISGADRTGYIRFLDEDHPAGEGGD